MKLQPASATHRQTDNAMWDFAHKQMVNCCAAISDEFNVAPVTAVALMANHAAASLRTLDRDAALAYLRAACDHIEHQGNETGRAAYVRYTAAFARLVDASKMHDMKAEGRA
ncbi:hypothetical protein [uncultured Sulfitobacter sp.]|uniref:hypothetical protein n=1 Tax=uncultured Sulfitobacter sp. TaxID=191468 RepID=UPI0026380896|nr:hypothetical protein [uncultured Sulfitobacter sp.]